MYVLLPEKYIIINILISIQSEVDKIVGTY